MRPLAALLALLAALALPAPAYAGEPETPSTRADYVIVAGVPGLRWEDLSPAATPNLWHLAEQGSIGSLSVRSAVSPTCPGDGWTTLSAGNYAYRGLSGNPPKVTGPCPRGDEQVTRTKDGLGASLPVDEQRLIIFNNSKNSWGAVPSALPNAVRCTVAVGPGAAVATVRPYGRVDRYEPAVPDDAAQLAALFGSCVLSVADLGTVDAQLPADRRAQAAQADALLAKVLAARPPNSTVIVAGVSDTAATDQSLHVAIVDGPGWAGGWLTSAGTGRNGYIQLIDLAPTILHVLGRPAPGKLFRGTAALPAQGRPTDLNAAIGVPAGADLQARVQKGVAGWFFGVLMAVQLAAFVAVGFLLRRSYTKAGLPTRFVRGIPRWNSWAELTLVAAAVAIPAALAAGLVPWWKSGHPGWVFWGLTLAGIVLATVVVRLLPPFRRTLGPAGMVAALAAVAVGVDLATGAKLQLNGVAGYSALEGGRYSGLGVVGLGVFISGVLLAAGCLAQIAPRRHRPWVVGSLGGLAVVFVGDPYLGADAGGAIALTAGVCVAAAICTGGWLTITRLVYATLAGVLVTGVFAAIDLHRPEADRGSLGRFITQLLHGSTGLTVHRLSESNVTAFVGTPLTLLAIGAAIFVWSVLLRPWGGLKRLFGVYPAVRAAVTGIAVATILAGLVGGAALNVAGAAAATVVPLLALGALRVRGHADERTVAQDQEADVLLS
ncbi:hypothetical protein [Hamadaea tsunoensis]|uniref:hypothetical protein n=1 Tax=Hamadaea tsunoensis TaxID=53368 RepID=UPI000409F6ED|nr:hypothetical protein [Hamadaea tsunoensis]